LTVIALALSEAGDGDLLPEAWPCYLALFSSLTWPGLFSACYGYLLQAWPVYYDLSLGLALLLTYFGLLFYFDLAW
jgi:hypothetical protein